MIRLVRAEFRKLMTTQVWFWLLLATIAVSALLIVAQIAPHDGVRTAADVPELFTSSVRATATPVTTGASPVRKRCASKPTPRASSGLEPP